VLETRATGNEPNVTIFASFPSQTSPALIGSLTPEKKYESYRTHALEHLAKHTRQQIVGSYLAKLEEVVGEK